MIPLSLGKAMVEILFPRHLVLLCFNQPHPLSTIYWSPISGQLKSLNLSWIGEVTSLDLLDAKESSDDEAPRMHPKSHCHAGARMGSKKSSIKIHIYFHRAMSEAGQSFSSGVPPQEPH